MTAPALANPDLARLHTQLIAVVRQLDEAIGAATSEAQVGLIAGEITAVNARVADVGRHLLRQQTPVIALAAARVTEAVPAVERAIRELADVAAFVRGIAGFLAIVDQVVAAASPGA